MVMGALYSIYPILPLHVIRYLSANTWRWINIRVLLDSDLDVTILNTRSEQF